MPGNGLICRCSSMVEHRPSKASTRVRFPSPTPISGCSEAWLSLLIWDEETAGSNPVIRTTWFRRPIGQSIHLISGRFSVQVRTEPPPAMIAGTHIFLLLDTINRSARLGGLSYLKEIMWLATGKEVVWLE